jgi:hypothetical protein
MIKLLLGGTRFTYCVILWWNLADQSINGQHSDFAIAIPITKIMRAIADSSVFFPQRFAKWISAFLPLASGFLFSFVSLVVYKDIPRA